ncbi:hypothetical protein SUNI508_12338 [Seiridium unicorne]|uniref:Uncharacterized protein n=1 Tax=Seiridium unicorne TaxID=138068 RepID=A0ABR2UEK6_9PEZI
MSERTATGMRRDHLYGVGMYFCGLNADQNIQGDSSAVGVNKYLEWDSFVLEVSDGGPLIIASSVDDDAPAAGTAFDDKKS